MKKVFLSLFFLLPIAIFAESGATSTGTIAPPTTVDADSMVSQMKGVLDQYALRIKALERENAILRTAVMQAGIKIPAAVYMGTGVVDNTTVQIITPTPPKAIVVSGEVDTSNIATTYGTRYAGFIQKIHTDWPAIQKAYGMSSGSYIGGYEFITGSTDNHVFVDIIYPGHTVKEAVYDAKILYQYNTGTYQRKLIGFFEYDTKTGLYTTKTGTNPFKGVPRLIIADPSMKAPPSAAVNINTTPSSASGGYGGSYTGITQPPVSTGSVTFADIESAYANKRLLSVISLSNTYLATNPPTFDLLRIRYRTYFIIGKFTGSLAEIAKIESLGKMTSAVACDAQVIATYSQNQSLVDKYTKLCKK